MEITWRGLRYLALLSVEPAMDINDLKILLKKNGLRSDGDVLATRISKLNPDPFSLSFSEFAMDLGDYLKRSPQREDLDFSNISLREFILLAYGESVVGQAANCPLAAPLSVG